MPGMASTGSWHYALPLHRLWQARSPKLLPMDWMVYQWLPIWGLGGVSTEGCHMEWRHPTVLEPQWQTMQTIQPIAQNK